MVEIFPLKPFRIGKNGGRLFERDSMLFKVKDSFLWVSCEHIFVYTALLPGLTQASQSDVGNTGVLGGDRYIVSDDGLLFPCKCNISMRPWKTLIIRSSRTRGLTTVRSPNCQDCGPLVKQRMQARIEGSIERLACFALAHGFAHSGLSQSVVNRIHDHPRRLGSST